MTRPVPAACEYVDEIKQRGSTSLARCAFRPRFGVVVDGCSMLYVCGGHGKRMQRQFDKHDVRVHEVGSSGFVNPRFMEATA